MQAETQMKLNLCLTGLPFSGNGGGQIEHPALRHWFTRTVLDAKADPRIDQIIFFDVAETPVTMARNMIVQRARKEGADVLIMFDSDMKPDSRFGIDPGAKRFFNSSFDFLYSHWKKGPVVIGAPYCSPPPYESPMVFQWTNTMNEQQQSNFKLEMFTRAEVQNRIGFENVDALPTGLIMYDLRVFDDLPHPYFYYEYVGDGPCCEYCGCRKPGPQAEKASTEDVTNTRDIALHFLTKYNYNPLFVNWDAWAIHWKQYAVDKPRLITSDQVGAKLKQAVLDRVRSDEYTTMIGEDDAADHGITPLHQQYQTNGSH